MPVKAETIATFTRFVSIAVLSCLLMTGGMWFYHNRAEIVEGTDSPEGGNWFTRWAGIDATKLTDEYTKNLMGEHVTKLPLQFEIGPEMIQQLHKSYTWDGNDN